MTRKSTTNLKVLKPSRKKVREGDLFLCQLPDDSYLAGRVVSTSALAGGFPDSNLIYIYDSRSADRPDRIDPGKCSVPERLLVPPLMTNNLPWRLGLFETILNEPLKTGEVLASHCFVSPSCGTYFDGNGGRIETASEPVGLDALHSYRTIDDEISEALGFDLVPDSD